MPRAHIELDKRAVIAPVRRRTFGAFVEHLGRCVYTGLYEPGHPTANEDGFRMDVVELVQELGTTTVRYPGGNFVSGFRWEDSVGPRDKRPVRRDLAWHSLESNQVGLDEFARWLKLTGAELMLAVNLGTRGILPALDLLEYANHPSGTALSDLRIANGTPEPHNVRMWCLGNEMDGSWQQGFMTADDYGRIAARTAAAMRMADRNLELVVCGSSDSSLATFGDWERTVLEHSYEYVDYVSCHAYYQELDGDLGSFLASALDMEFFIDTVVATADHVGHKKRSKKKMQLSFDEWNVWYLKDHQEAAEVNDEWSHAPRLLEDVYTVADAVVVGNLLMTLLKHSDRVTLGVARPAGQRDRADHDRARRACLAADDLLPVRDHEPARVRRGDPSGDRGADVRHGAPRRGPRHRRRRDRRRRPRRRVPRQPRPQRDRAGDD